MRRLGEDERRKEGAADRKLWKERTERVARQYTPVQQGTRRMNTSCGFLPSNLSRLCQAINKHGHKCKAVRHTVLFFIEFMYAEV